MHTLEVLGQTSVWGSFRLLLLGAACSGTFSSTLWRCIPGCSGLQLSACPCVAASIWSEFSFKGLWTSDPRVHMPNLKIFCQEKKLHPPTPPQELQSAPLSWGFCSIHFQINWLASASSTYCHGLTVNLLRLWWRLLPVLRHPFRVNFL